MHPFTNLGLALRWMRNRQRRNQDEVARTAGITKAMLSAYETGKQHPSIDTLGKLLLALDADLPELYEALLVHRGSPLSAFAARRAIDRTDPS